MIQQIADHLVKKKPHPSSYAHTPRSALPTVKNKHGKQCYVNHTSLQESP
jgi:hypothetical protein